MRLLRVGPAGKEKPAAMDVAGNLRDLSGVINDINGSTISKAGLAKLRALDLSTLPMVPAGVRLGACVGNVPNLIAIGLNYTDHAAETGSKLPSQPIVFNKHTSCLCGANDNIVQPPGSEMLDWEVEFGVVIGTPAWHVEKENALDYVAGYCLANDVSERDYQTKREGQWTKGKSYFSFAPLGPWLLTADEMADPHKVKLWLDVNGKRYQNGTTANLIFGIAEIVSYLSRFMALLPGDVIITGTPAGVGFGQKPFVFLKAGDVVTLGADGLGEQKQTVVAYDDAMGKAWRSGEWPKI